MAYAGKDFAPPANPEESEVYAIDFALQLLPGETISTVTWNMLVAAKSAAPDATPQSRRSGSATINGTVVSQRLAGMLAGVTYVTQAIVATSFGNTLEVYSHIPCVAAS